MQQGYFQEQKEAKGKRERTRLALLDAAVEVVAEKGMEATKISDITNAAGMANGTFYNYFREKDEILREAAYRIALEVAQQLDTDMSSIDDAAKRVVIATSHAISLLVSEPDWARVLLDSADHMPDMRMDIFQYLRTDLQLGVSQGKFDVEVTPFLVDQIVSLMGVSIRTQLDAGRDENLIRETCENILRLLGVGVARARKIVEQSGMPTGLLPQSRS